MLDHPFLHATAAVRKSLEDSMLECQRPEEGLAFDLLLGDVEWETSYALPGEGALPRIKCDLSFGWSTWSQTAFRSWTIGEELEEMPDIIVSLDLHVAGLATAPDVAAVLRALPPSGPALGSFPLDRKNPSMEQSFEKSGRSRFALDVAYEGLYEVGEQVLEHIEALYKDMGPLGGWVASTLVKLNDLGFDFLPPEAEEID
jgi:hypothetical protein